MMTRWLVLFLVSACDSTFSPQPPHELAPDARAIAVAHNYTLAVTELPPSSLANLISEGSAVPSPVDADGDPLALDLPPARDVAVGRAHACVVSTTGSVHCWGDHARGALGLHRACLPPTTDGGEPDCTLGALLMPALPPARHLVAGDDVTCALLVDDHVVCWGHTGPTLGGSVLPSLDPPTPVKLPSGAALVATRLVMARGDVCAIDRDARAWCWGDDFGAVPALQPQLGVVDIAMGTRHDCIIDRDGLACWGDNRNGQVGDFESAKRCRRDKPCVIPIPHHIDFDATRVVVGERHTCAVRAGDGAVACWGSNEVGQLGRDDAFLVGDLGFVVPDAVDLAAGYAHTCALRAGGAADCWGSTFATDPEITP